MADVTVVVLPTYEEIANKIPEKRSALDNMILRWNPTRQRGPFSKVAIENSQRTLAYADANEQFEQDLRALVAEVRKQVISHHKQRVQGATLAFLREIGIEAGRGR